jgi:glycyl-tRNA synthetase alpha chain
VGWQVLMDGMEISQFTYFQQAGGIDLAPISAEITYGVERVALFLGKARSIFDVMWNDRLTYGQIRHQEEVELSRYSFEVAETDWAQTLFERSEREARLALAAGLVLPAYEATLLCSHEFNLLDARGAVSATERVTYIRRVRDLACAVARAYVASREAKGFPLVIREPAEVAS